MSALTYSPVDLGGAVPPVYLVTAGPLALGYVRRIRSGWYAYTANQASWMIADGSAVPWNSTPFPRRADAGAALLTALA